MNKDNIAIFGDLTALYYFRITNRRSICYSDIDQTLKQTFNVDNYDHNMWFSLFNPGNAKQTSFINTIKEIGWNIDTTNTRDIRRLRDCSEYRFDTRIAFELGNAIEQFNNVVIVSDSYELLPVLEQFHIEDPDCKINLAFFAEGIDTRWIRTLRQPDCFINFIELEN